MTAGFVSGTGTQVPVAPTVFRPQFTTGTPRQVVVINASRYIPIDVEITQRAHGSTDTATITLPIGSNPDFSQELFRGVQPGALPIDNSNDPVYVQIYQGFPSNPSPGSTDISALTRTFYGLVDMYSASFHDNTVTFTCRSLAAPLITNKLTRISIAETSIQFAQACATYAGLQLVTKLLYPPVTVQGVLQREFIGGYNFAASLYGMHYWDLLVQCALWDDVDVWVDQNTLYYCAPSLIARTTIPLVYGKDFLVEDGVTGTHSVQFNKQIKVIVHSWTPRTRVATTTSVQSDGSGGFYAAQNIQTVTSASPNFGTPSITSYHTDSNGNRSATTSEGFGGGSTGSTSIANDSAVQRYVWFLRNKTPADCNRFAYSQWRQLSQHQYQLDLAVPMTAKIFKTFTRTALLNISGLPYHYFNAGTLPGVKGYYPRQVTSRFSVTDGWKLKINTLNNVLPTGEV